jgi:hypothetical protein
VKSRISLQIVETLRMKVWRGGMLGSGDRKGRAFDIVKALYCPMERTEIEAAARQLVWLHGPRAQTEAMARADKMFTVGDIAGFHKWNRVKDAIKDLERKEQAPIAP